MYNHMLLMDTDIVIPWEHCLILKMVFHILYNIYTNRCKTRIEYHGEVHIEFLGDGEVQFCY